MLVRDIMTRDIHLLAPHSTLREAARQMRDDSIGLLPMAAGDRLVGYVTDRDFAVRSLADGSSDDTPVQGGMTDRVLYCFEDKDVKDVALNMAYNQSVEDALEGVSKPAR